uniref:Copper-transporting ATPase PAA1, chloroplastic n=2 Tax=Anthurium amnicola TaxID=1678845 RepID=A0A1D1YAP0_9ARAE
MLIAFVLLGRNLEQRAKLKATSDMTGLLNILPTKARLMIESDIEKLPSVVEVPCSSLSVGDRIVVLPGDRVPADGIVTAGRSTVDESSFTGEPLPATKLPGAEVTAGSINLNGTLTVEVRRPGGETVMGDIVRMVEEAQSREAPVQRLADKISGRFTYGVMAFTAATFMFWNLLGLLLVPTALQHGSPISLALQLSCSVLVVACPCALGLATPTAVMVGTSLGATRGLLIRGGSVLEKFSGVDTIVFDKTGTLTNGKPVVTKVLTFGSQTGGNQVKQSFTWTESEILRLAAGVEVNTIHPVGKAIVEAAQAAGCNNAKADDGTFSEEPGSGAIAIVEQKQVTIGTLEWLRRNGVHQKPVLDMEEPENQSAVYVGVDGNLAGVVYFEDEIREDARQVVESLSKQRISIYMLSGDNKNTAEHVASIVGINKDKVLSGVKPSEKKKFIRDLQSSHKVVAMVGDGVNDAAALASSDVGIAMGGGVGAASDVSSIVLMGNRLSQLPEALELSRMTMRTVRQNLWWAFAYNIVGIPVAAGLLLPVTGTILTPSIAGALMGLSSIGVMANSLLLRIRLASKWKPNPKFQQGIEHLSGSDVVRDIDEQPVKSHTGKWTTLDAKVGLGRGAK